MSECMSSPWIRDYFLGVAEKYGANLFNTPVADARKKVQLTDLLTLQENSYVWAWISDKDHRVSVRISKDAVNQYKSIHGRNIINSRFSVIFVSKYRPMFSPRPLGPNAPGNTPVSHISLEIGHVKSLGVSDHLFGNPHDLESDENMKEWVLGLRQDGGGGNVLKLRKQQELAQDKNPQVSPPSPPPFSLYAPVSPRRTSKAIENVTKPRSEQPEDFKRAYAKRWRIIEPNPWRLAHKPAAKGQTESGHPLVEQRLDTTPQLESRNHCPPLPHTPSPASRSQQQGTPTDWSPSNRGSPIPLGEPPASDNVQRHDEPEVMSSPLHPPSDAGGDTTVDAAITPDTPSLQPPTPAQRIKPTSPRSSTPRTSPALACSPPSEQLPCSSPPPLSSSLPLPSSSLPISTSLRKNIQRKVPHPGHPVHHLEPAKQGPAKILVPNSDTPGPVSQIENEAQENGGLTPRHDSQAWKEPSFATRHKVKIKALAVKEADTSSVKAGKKRRPSAQPKSPVSKRVKVATEEAHRVVPDPTTSGRMQHQGEGPTDRPLTSAIDTGTETTTLSTILQLHKPRLANLAIDFERIDLGENVQTPMVDMIKDIKSTMLRTGRIRTLGKEVEEDGKVYIMR